MKTRKWLEKNRIFFEIFSYTFLGLASIAVAYLSWSTSEKQLKLAEIERQPVINVQQNTADEKKAIQVHNNGFHLWEPIILVESFFEVQNFIAGRDDNSIRYHFKVWNYYEHVLNSPSSTGKLADISIDSSAVGIFEKLRDEVWTISFLEEMPYDFKRLDIVWIAYNDIYGVQRRKYFLVDEIIQEITTENYNYLKSRIQDNYSISDFKKLEAKELVERVSSENVYGPFR